jgi:metallo-beta-lactamase family protein
MKLSFHGAAKTVTGSKHLVHLDNGKKILLDCGLFQGLGKDTIQLNNEWGFEPSTVNYVILSHAHIDHVGLLPKLIKDGFTGTIYCTEQTRELSGLLLLDSARIQEMEAQQINRIRASQQRLPVEPLYTEEDVARVFPQVTVVPYDTPFAIDDDIELLLTNSGHVIGSATINLTITESTGQTSIAFSGDIGRYNDMMLCDPDVFPQADYIIMESTYGNKLHNVLHSSTEKLLACIEDVCMNKGGKLIIPAFSLGRTQEILYLLNRLENERRLPDVKYYVDSPLSVKATEITKLHADSLNERVQELLKKDDDVFKFQGLEYVEHVDDSIALSDRDEPCVIISASGMAESGRVKYHIAQHIQDPACGILLVGYCEPHSLGGQLHNGKKQVSIYGQEQDVKAEVFAIDSMSAHGDYEDLCKWLGCQDPEKTRHIFLVHGEYDTQIAFKDRLHKKGFHNVTIPGMHQEVAPGDIEVIYPVKVAV